MPKKGKNNKIVENFTIYGGPAKWKQFQSWRRIRYKITIKKDSCKTEFVKDKAS